MPGPMSGTIASRKEYQLKVMNIQGGISLVEVLKWLRRYTFW